MNRDGTNTGRCKLWGIRGRLQAVERGDCHRDAIARARKRRPKPYQLLTNERMNLAAIENHPEILPLGAARRFWFAENGSSLAPTRISSATITRPNASATRTWSPAPGSLWTTGRIASRRPGKSLSPSKKGSSAPIKSRGNYQTCAGEVWNPDGTLGKSRSLSRSAAPSVIFAGPSTSGAHSP